MRQHKLPLVLVVVVVVVFAATMAHAATERSRLESIYQGGTLIVGDATTTVALWAENQALTSTPHEARIVMSYTEDQGLTWTTPEVVFQHGLGTRSWSSGNAWPHLSADAVMDELGVVHMVLAFGFRYGDDLDGWTEVLYGQLDLAQGTIVNQYLLSEKAADTNHPPYGPVHIALGPPVPTATGRYLHVVYGDDTLLGNDSAAYWYVRSTDSGASWTGPVDIKGYSGCDGPSASDLAADNNGNVYFTYGPEWDGYARVHFCASTDNGQTWSWQHLDSAQDSGGPSLLVDDSDNVYLYYNTNQGTINYMTSPDNGGTWSSEMAVAPRLNPGHVAGTRVQVGWADQVLGRVHMAFTDRVVADEVDLEIFYTMVDISGSILIAPLLQSVVGAENHPDFASTMIVHDEDTVMVGAHQRFYWDFDEQGIGFSKPYAMRITHITDAVMEPLETRVIPLGGLSLWPNPTRSAAALGYHLDRDQFVSVEVYDVSGRLVRVLSRDVETAGSRVITWDGRNNAGKTVAQGVYHIRVTAEQDSWTEKVSIVR